MKSLRPLHLVLISGPPRIGKNHSGTALADKLKGDHFALSDYLKVETHNHYGIENASNIFAFEKVKDIPNPNFNGKTPREAYIDFSENILKPKYGLGYLGKLVIPRMKSNIVKNTVSIISGVGFYEEVKPLIFTAKSESTLHIKLLPPLSLEKDLEDSRKEINLSNLGVEEIATINVNTSKFITNVYQSILDVFSCAE